jgi:hypothetical protein
MRPYTTREKAKITAGAITALIIVGWGGILAGDTFRQMKRPPTEAALLLFQFSDLLAEFFFHFADHLRRRAVRELFRQLTAFSKPGFYFLFFPGPIHNCMAAGSGEGSKQATLNFKLGH